MAGVYIHIPFCASKCGYCAFYSVVSATRKNTFLSALDIEMERRSDYLGGEKVGTIYFGGGTPSLLSQGEIGHIINRVRQLFSVEPEAEITLEANPDQLTDDYLKAIHDLGINRLSIGIQSFFDDDLRYLGRRHNAVHARRAIESAQEEGFDKLTIDLIYGIPTLSDEKWNSNLDIFFATGIGHLSAYALTLEENTVLTHKINKGILAPVDDDIMVGHYNILTGRCAAEGFEHYEVSNFARPGYRSRHNTSYWTGDKYVGFGPSAHSFDGKSRQWNLASVDKWACSVAVGQQFEREELTMKDLYNEYVMTGLRTSWGCDMKYMKSFGNGFYDHCLKQARPYIMKGHLTLDGDRLRTTTAGLLFADAIAADLFAD